VIGFLVRRVLWAIFVFLVATIATYAIFFVIPSNPALLAAGFGVDRTPEFVAHIRSEFHLDVPVYQQYWIFLWNLLRHGSLGYSFVNRQPVRFVVGQDLPVTGSLILGGAVFWLAVSLPVGILSALRPRSLGDRLGMIFVLVGVSAHPVWIGYILSWLFGFRLGWMPIAGYCSFLPSHDLTVACSGPPEWAYHLLLPWITYMLLFAALYVRMIRANVMETMSEDYVRTARAKGASPTRVVIHHVLRNSLLPVVTILGMDIGFALSGAIFTETVFNLHGLGAELVAAATRNNLPVVVGIVLCVTAVVIVFNFAVDVAYGFLDPRTRLSVRSAGVP
jgi:peptide/nickel transport system permease protein